MGVSAAILAQQLDHYGHGRAIWNPEPMDGDVYVGDVGYFDEDGAFHRMFNVTVDAGHPINSEGVPKNFTPLRFNPRLLQIKPNHFNPMPFCSRSVRSYRVDAHAGAQAGPAGLKLAYSYECTTSEGALLVLRDHADKTLVVPSTDIEQYISQFHDSWVVFAREVEKLSCDHEDIVMVRGTVKTSAWTVAAFKQPGTRIADFELGAQVGSVLDMGITGSSSVVEVGTFEFRTGPVKSSTLATLVPVRSKSSGRSRKYELPEIEVAEAMLKEAAAGALSESAKPRNQSVFIGCYRVKRRLGGLLPKKIVANAGPADLPPGEDPAESAVVTTREDIVVEIDHPAYRPHTALDDILDYILQFSDAKMAIASDGDLCDLFPESSFPDDMRGWLLENRPVIDVDDHRGGTLSKLWAIRRAHLNTQKKQEAAAQEHWEERQAALASLQQEAEDRAVAERIALEALGQGSEFQQGSSGLSPEERAETATHSAEAQPEGSANPGAAVALPEWPASALADPRNSRGLGDDGDFIAQRPLPAFALAQNGQLCDPISGMPEERLSGTCVMAEGKILIESPYGGTRITDIPHVVLSDGSAEGGSVTSVSVTKDGRLVATGCEDCAVRIYDLALGTLTDKYERHEDTVWAVAFSPDGSRLVSGGADNKAYMWDAHTREFVAGMQGHTGDVWLLAWAPDGSIVATGSVDTTIRLWGGRDGALIAKLEGHNAVVMCLTFSPDGKQLASCADSTGIIWDVAAQKEVTRLQGHASVLWTLAWSADGTRLVTGAEDHSSRVWDAESGVELATVNEHTGPVWSAVFSPDGRDIASGSYDATVVICDSYTAERRHVLECDSPSIVNVVAYSAAGDLLACGLADGRMRVWNPIEGTLVAELQGHDDKVKTVEFTADDERIVSSSDDGTVRIWNVLDALRL